MILDFSRILINIMNEEIITLKHGEGAKASYNLIREVFLKKLSNPVIAQLADAATLGSTVKY